MTTLSVSQGPEKCDSCKNYELKAKLNGTVIHRCLEKCPDMYYADEHNVCRPCHEFCDEGWVKCRNYCVSYELKAKLNGTVIHRCLEKCPDMYYADEHNVCCPCHEFCDEGWVKCRNYCVSYELKAKLNGTVIHRCLEKCPDMYYADEHNVCRPCHEFCDEGWVKCRNYCVSYELKAKLNGTVIHCCLEKCPDTVYVEIFAMY